MPRKNKPKNKKEKKLTVPDRSQRMVLSEAEVLRRMAAFDERREAFIASVRKSKS